MSGFVALFHGDGRPIEESLIAGLTDAIAYRGPDGVSTQRLDGAAFGYAAFHTLDDSTELAGPAVLDDRIWVLADARLDDRRGLVRRLAASGREISDAPDALLIAHAYDAWGSEMTGNLLGDFAFVIWDRRNRLVLAGRDHMGIKPLYSAVVGDDLLVGNTLEGLRAHTSISSRLDEYAIGDYLLFGLNRHAERTSYADISRVPPAHTLAWSPGGSPSLRRYWNLRPLETMPTKDGEILEHFESLLHAAVADRVHGPAAAVLMSGGLDSTTVAALVKDEMKGRFPDHELHAVTFGYERWIEDDEPDIATLAADHLGLRHHVIALDDDSGDAFWSGEAAWSAEPNEFPASARMVREVSAAAPGVRVGFTGQGGDPALHITPADASHRAGVDGWSRTAAQLLLHRVRAGSVPRIGLRTQLKRTLRGRRYEREAFFPPWLRADVVERLDLQRRHREFYERDLDLESPRPEAKFQLDGPEWSFFLEWYDAGMTGFLAEYRHPLLDIRLLEFAMALPVIPWLAEKEILRRAMASRLPDAVIRRRKAPLAGFPLHQAVVEGAARSFGLAADNESLAEFIDVRRLESIVNRPERLRPSEYELLSRPLGLALWLSRMQ